MLVTTQDLYKLRMDVQSSRYAALDTETTGLCPFKDDRLFVITIATSMGNVYYLDFRDGSLSRECIPALFSTFSGTLFMHNAKFDMHHCYNEGLDLSAHDVHCTEAIGRIVKNDNLKYSLDALTGEKSDVVKKYITTNKLWVKYFSMGVEERKPQFDKVPIEIMQPYAEQDAIITLQLGLQQLDSIIAQQNAIVADNSIKKMEYDLYSLVEQEKKLTKVLFRMEQKGVRVDTTYIRDAHLFETAKSEKAARDFEAISGVEFKDANKTLALAFSAVGERFPTTDKGNPSFRDEVLEKMSSPLAKLLQSFRHSRMMANTFLSNLLEYKDANDIIHPNFKQAGTATGRMSCREPNLQNVPAKDEDQAEFPIRKCFIAEKDFLWFSIDWKAMEYRLMLDIAGELSLINAIKAGLDVHQATADMVGVTRTQAKSINFALLYGVGNAKLGRMIGVSETKAASIRRTYYSKLPKVAHFLKTVQRVAERRKFIINTYGRKLRFDNRDFAYKAPNYLIQGGCGDIMKLALIGIDTILKGKKSYVFLTVHDEADIMVHKDELHLLDDIKSCMENVYEHKHLPMEVSLEYSETNWHELKEWKK